MSTVEFLILLMEAGSHPIYRDTILAFIQAEEKGLNTVTVISRLPCQYQAVVEVIEKTHWRLSPLLTTGRPYSLPDGHVWILTNHREPEPEVIEEVDFFDRKDPQNWDDVIQVKPEEAEEWKLKGYEYTAKWKGLVELTLFKDPKMEEPRCPDGVLFKEAGTNWLCPCESFGEDQGKCNWPLWGAPEVNALMIDHSEEPENPSEKGVKK